MRKRRKGRIEKKGDPLYPVDSEQGKDFSVEPSMKSLSKEKLHISINSWGGRIAAKVGSFLGQRG